VRWKRSWPDQPENLPVDVLPCSNGEFFPPPPTEQQRMIMRLADQETERLRPIKGQPPSLIHVPPGCPFNPRCPYVMDICRTEVPQLIPADGHHASACHLPLSEKERIVKEEVLVH